MDSHHEESGGFKGLTVDSDPREWPNLPAPRISTRHTRQISPTWTSSTWSKILRHSPIQGSRSTMLFDSTHSVEAQEMVESINISAQVTSLRLGKEEKEPQVNETSRCQSALGYKEDAEKHVTTSLAVDEVKVPLLMNYAYDSIPDNGHQSLGSGQLDDPKANENVWGQSGIDVGLQMTQETMTNLVKEVLVKERQRVNLLSIERPDEIQFVANLFDEMRWPSLKPSLPKPK